MTGAESVNLFALINIFTCSIISREAESLLTFAMKANQVINTQLTTMMSINVLTLINVAVGWFVRPVSTVITSITKLCLLHTLDFGRVTPECMLITDFGVDFGVC
jgi:hypothetical protein